MFRFFATAIALSILFVACSSLPDSEVSHIYFDGARYRGGPSAGFDIDSADLTPVGEATRIAAEVDGATAYALSNVDPHYVLVMISTTTEAPYWIFFRDGAVPDGASFAEAVPGLCVYIEEAQPRCP